MKRLFGFAFVLAAVAVTAAVIRKNLGNIIDRIATEMFRKEY